MERWLRLFGQFLRDHTYSLMHKSKPKPQTLSQVVGLEANRVSVEDSNLWFKTTLDHEEWHHAS